MSVQEGNRGHQHQSVRRRVTPAPTQGCSTTMWATLPRNPQRVGPETQGEQRERERPSGRPPAGEGGEIPQGALGRRAREVGSLRQQTRKPRTPPRIFSSSGEPSLSLTDQDTELLRQLPPSRGQDLSPDVLENDRPRLQVHHQHGPQLGLGPLQFNLEGEAMEPLQPLKEGSAPSPKHRHKPSSPTSYLSQGSSH